MRKLNCSSTKLLPGSSVHCLKIWKKTSRLITDIIKATVTWNEWKSQDRMCATPSADSEAQTLNFTVLSDILQEGYRTVRQLVDSHRHTYANTHLVTSAWHGGDSWARQLSSCSHHQLPTGCFGSEPLLSVTNTAWTGRNGQRHTLHPEDLKLKTLTSPAEAENSNKSCVLLLTSQVTFWLLFFSACFWDSSHSNTADLIIHPA